MIGFGLAVQALLGAWHLYGLRLIKKIRPVGDEHPHLGVLAAFWGLGILHFSEIVLGAAAYALALTIPAAGNISQVEGSQAAELLYFSGTTFTTLGLTHQQASGPIRLLVMLQSLGGFMLITWSATFVYTIWGELFRREG
ncbi:hypothetical protein WYH_02900 [Croceibacterium atlanticum]|uniref:Potassium channel domain-containing protein n=2 Tax=Croceibacterium atlanticum TaxID=1267766 RepID=A0A0F7KXJ6_9SPHN|nr:ion channel [Croceibacterium atlanticum]AKH43927.1 hypothetical protein WYH_02900 [Croceibacterium atlanticum]